MCSFTSPTTYSHLGKLPLHTPVPWLLCALQVEVSCKHRCLEDLTSTTRFVTWSLHTKSHKALKNMMGKLQLADPTRTAGTGARCCKLLGLMFVA